MASALEPQLIIKVKGKGRGRSRAVKPEDLKFEFEAKNDKEAIKQARAILKALNQL